MRFYFLLLLWFYAAILSGQSGEKEPSMAEWDSLGYQLVALLNAQSTDMDYYFSSTAFWKRVLIKNSRNKEVRQLNKELLEDGQRFQLSSVFLEGGQGTEYTYLRSRKDSTLIVRQRINEIEFNYILFKVDYLQQDWKVVDLYLMIYGTYLSTLIRNTIYFPTVFEALKRDNAALILANSKIYREAKHLYGEGEVERAYIKLSGIPVEERLREYQVYKIFLATKVEEDNKLIRSVDEYRERFEDRGDLDLLFLDYYIVTEEYHLALEAAARIDARIGGDIQLQFYKGVVHFLEDDWKKSVSVLQEALLLAPSEEYYISFVIALLEEKKSYAWAVEILQQSAEGGVFSAADLISWAQEKYPTLAKKRVFKRWVKQVYR